VISIAAKRKTTTSTEVKRRYNEKTYKRYQIYLRVEDDKHLIDYIDKKKETQNTSEIFKQALETLLNEGK